MFKEMLLLNLLFFWAETHVCGQTQEQTTSPCSDTSFGIHYNCNVLYSPINPEFPFK